MPWASRMGTWQTNQHPTTPKISVPFGECLVVVCLVVVEAPAGVGLRYLAGKGSLWNKLFIWPSDSAMQC